MILSLTLSLSFANDYADNQRANHLGYHPVNPHGNLFHILHVNQVDSLLHIQQSNQPNNLVPIRPSVLHQSHLGQSPFLHIQMHFLLNLRIHSFTPYFPLLFFL